MTLLLLISLSIAAPPAAPSPISVDEYRVYCAWRASLSDQPSPPAELTAKIAKAAALSPKAVSAIVAKGDALGGTCDAISERQKAEADFALHKTTIGPRIESLDVDASDPSMVIAYVSWRRDKPERFEEEGALVAAEIARTVTILHTLSLRIVGQPDTDSVLFEATISAVDARAIDAAKIDKLADTDYLDRFRNVIYSTSSGPCCRVCAKSTPCGDSCVTIGRACSKPAGCACAGAKP